MSATVKTKETAIYERLNALRASAAIVERAVNAIAWDTDVEKVVELQGRREALALLIGLAEREQAAQTEADRQSFLNDQAIAAQRERETRERHREAVESVVALGEEIAMFAEEPPSDPYRRTDYENNLHRRMSAWLTAPLKGRSPQAATLQKAIERDGFKPYIEYLRARQKQITEKFGVTDTEIAERAAWVVKEREDLVILINKGVMKPYHSPVVGIVHSKVTFEE